MFDMRMDKLDQRRTRCVLAALSLRPCLAPLSLKDTVRLERPRHAVGAIVEGMERPGRFEHSRYLGDKRTQLVYDLDEWSDVGIIDDIVESGVGLSFGPDTLAEARNRGYTQATSGSSRRHRKPRA